VSKRISPVRLLRSHLLMLCILFLSKTICAQCPSATGDQVSYGSGSWIGYVYDGADNYAPASYQGTILESANFDESFCGDNCTFTANSGCGVNSETFTVRFKMKMNVVCGTYQFTIGGDDGVRLSIDGGSTYLLSSYTFQAYTTLTTTTTLTAGTYNLVLEYFENSGQNRVSFNSTLLTAGTGGVIAGDQNICQPAPIDPAAFTSTSDAVFCSGATPIYQWQSSPNNATWSDIGGATSSTYDIPAGFSIGTTYYRRRASDGSTPFIYSNVVTVMGDSPQGDQTTYGAGSWIGYVYDGVNNFSSNYYGYMTEAMNFNESFCGGACTFPLNGCDIFTETFTVRFKMQAVLCGDYQFTIGGDDGVRLSLDGGATFLINDYTDHGYRTVSANATLNGTYNVVLEYYENGGGNQVSFSSTLISPGDGGTVASSQSICQGPVDPAAFTNVASAFFCTGISPSYQWENSPDNSTWSDVGGATSSTYDIPSGLANGTHYYRRRATDGTTTLYSNTVTIVADAQGDQVTFGSGSWIGYTYDGANSFTTSNYQGYFTEASTFDESFCGDACTFAINGCDILTETFTVRFKMRITLPSAGYTFTIGADDGVRLSLDGGSTYLLNDYSDHGYRTITSAVTNLNGTYDLVLDYYENSGGNRISFNYTAGPLPVKWTYFDGHYENGNNIIEWQTASEENNQGYKIERSLNSSQFATVGWLDGHGTTTAKQYYTFTDSLPSSGWNYYRLNQIDFDGHSEESRIIPIFVDPTDEIHLYPNPASNYVFVSGINQQTAVTFTITDLATFNTIKLEQDPAQPARFKLTNVMPGIYSAEIRINDKLFRKKIIIN